MDESLKKVSAHMYEFGTSLLAHGIEHLILRGRGAPFFAGAFGLHHIVHGTELLMKAAISMEHPFLIFSKLPKPASDRSALVLFEDLVRDGQTATYNELPDLLWAVTGFRLPDVPRFREVGRKRNAIQHFAVPDENYLDDGIRYACSVTDPLLQRFWSRGVFEAAAAALDEEDPYVFESDVLRETLMELNIDYKGWLPPPEA